MPESVEDCVDSVLEENPDMDESQAYAICKDAEQKGNLVNLDPQGAEVLNADGQSRLHEPARTLEGGRVERVDEENDAVRYTDICLLAPGEWTDAASRTTIYYAPDAIKRSARNWIDTQVNLYHKPGDPIANVGHIDTDSVYTDDSGALYADMVLHGRTQNSKDAIGLMDLALESEGERGLGGPSVEIPEDKTEWDDTRGMERMTEMTFSGAALVMHPASRKVSFDEQFENRAVALAQLQESRDIRIMRREETTKRAAGEADAMGSSTDDPLKELADARNRLRKLARELQNPTDELLAAINTYNASDEGSPEDSIEDFVQWAETADVPDEAIDLAREADVESVDELEQWATSTTTSEEEEENPDGEDMGDDGEEMQGPGEESVGGDQPGPGGDAGGGDGMLPDETARAIASALDDVASTISDVQSAVEDEIDGAQMEMQDAREELTAELAEVKDRIAALEDSGEPKTMTDAPIGDDPEAEKKLDAAADTPVSDGNYITR